MQSGRIEDGRCNYEVAIAHFRKGADELQKQDCDTPTGSPRNSYFVGLATTPLLKHMQYFRTFRKSLSDA
jgi:hypothetical protein